MTMADMPVSEKTMADRHRDEIAAIIADGEAKIASHKEIAFWNEQSGMPKPIGHNSATVGQATKAIAVARAAISKAIADACARHRIEANAPPPTPKLVEPAPAEQEPAHDLVDTLGRGH
jgi:hypothetical protein